MFNHLIIKQLGLDIYFHKSRIPFEGDATNAEDFKAYTDKVDADAKANLQAFIDKNIKPLEEAWEKSQDNDYWVKIYNERYFEFVTKLKKILAVNYDFRIHPYTEKILTLPELKERLKSDVDWHYADYDAYFRKVNFIFNFYENTLGTMVDQWYAVTNAEEIDDLIDRCERVLAKTGDQEYAHQVLPTQSGFFFGSTEYDDWYFSDVKDCLRQMKKFRKGLTDDMTAYVIFSW